ncbi:hypothetical protein C8R44DRAFT_780698 [Mycena epipterygia]|nr:hypothetical protein C8R44DRAFT_780698 [Mycena epipterygia]
MGDPAPPPTHDDRRSLITKAYAGGGSFSPDFTRGGSLNPDFVRGGSMSPEGGHAHGQGHIPMTEDELVYTPSRSRSASADPANGVPSSHPCTDSAPVRISPHIGLLVCQYTRRAVRGPRPPLSDPSELAPLDRSLLRCFRPSIWWRCIASFSVRRSRFLFFFPYAYDFLNLRSLRLRLFLSYLLMMYQNLCNTLISTFVY